jgi:hypothetical protein
VQLFFGGKWAVFSQVYLYDSTSVYGKFGAYASVVDESWVGYISFLYPNRYNFLAYKMSS